MQTIPELSLRLFILLWITSKRQLIHDTTARRTQWDEKYDFVVVGGGTAGCAVAARLSEDPNVKVLLLEAGGAQDALYNDIPALAFNITEERPHLIWKFNDEPQQMAGGQFPERRVPNPRGKTLGGSSTNNYMVFNRGNPRDYDLWRTKYGAEGWDFAGVLPFFRRIENNTDERVVRANPKWHGTSGPNKVSSVPNPPKLLRLVEKTFNEMGFNSTDVNGPQQTGTTLLQQFIDVRGFRAGAGNAYVDPNPRPDNLHIVTQALVLRVLFENKTAVGVEFSKNDKSFRVFVTKEVIVSAGNETQGILGGDKDI